MYKGTSEASVLSESEREHSSKVFLWGEGKRKRFPLQPFAGMKECFIILYKSTYNFKTYKI